MSQSDQLALVGGPDNGGGVERGAPRRCAGPSEHTMDKISYFSLGFVFVGLIFAAIGFLYPRDLRRNPGATARENEQVDIEYMNLTQALNSVIVTGMILIGLGGLTLSAIFTNSVVCHECHTHDDDDDDDNMPPPASSSSALTPTAPPPPQTPVSGGRDPPSQDYGTLSKEPAR